MRRRIKNTLCVTCSGLDLTTVSSIEFYIRQGTLFLEYSPEVLSATEMVVVVPHEDAVRLRTAPAKLQFAYVDANGNPMATNVLTTSVEDLLKEMGYDPV